MDAEKSVKDQIASEYSGGVNNCSKRQEAQPRALVSEAAAGFLFQS